MDTKIRSNLAVRMRTYDAFADATRRGIEVKYLPITTTRLVWLPEVNGVVISSHVDTTRQRRDLLAHAIAHADVENTQLMRKFRADKATRDQVERRVRRIAARRLIHSENLHIALTQTRSAALIADRFDVTIGTLADRIRDLTMREFRLFGKLIPGLEWPKSSHSPEPEHCGIGIARSPSRRQIITENAASVLAQPLTHACVAAAAGVLSILT